MSTGTKIEWTDATWNPVTGCSKVSPGCEHCYAERLSHRFGWTRSPWTGPNAAQNVRLHPERLQEPLRWRKPRTVFVCSMSDLFHERVPDEYIDEVLAVMALTPQHTYQVLTKRPERMRRYLTTSPNPRELPTRRDAVRETIYSTFNGYQPTAQIPWPLPNVWLGVSVEDQLRADERIPLLLDTPAAVRFVSCEPLLGPVKLMDCERIDWVIAGGESGPGARPMHPEWVRSIRDQCQAAGVPFFFKGWGEWLPTWREGVEVRLDSLKQNEQVAAGGNGGHILFRRVGKKRAGRLLDGRTWDEMPRVTQREVV